MSFTSGASRWTDVWVAGAARFLSTCGDFLAATALALALQAAGAGGLAVAGLMLASTLPLVALSPLTGRLADRVDSRLLLIVTGLAQAAVCATLAYADQSATILLLVALLACGMAITQPVLAALLPVMVRSEDLPRASAVSQTSSVLGVLAGPALAGLLVGHFGTRLPLLIDAASFLSLVVAGLLLRTRRGGTPTVPPSVDAGPSVSGAGWRLRHDPLLAVLVFGGAAVVSVLGVINVVNVFYVREDLGGSPTVYGLISGGWPLGMIAGSWLAARLVRRLTDDGRLVRATLVALGGCSLAVLAASTVSSALLLLPIWLLGGLGNGANNVFNNQVLARRVPQEYRGRAYAMFMGAIQGASMVGFLAGGALLGLLPARTIVGGVGMLGLLVVLAALWPAYRAERREREQRATVPPVDGPERSAEGSPASLGAVPAS